MDWGLILTVAAIWIGGGIVMARLFGRQRIESWTASERSGGTAPGSAVGFVLTWPIVFLTTVVVLVMVLASRLLNWLAGGRSE